MVTDNTDAGIEWMDELECNYPEIQGGGGGGSAGGASVDPGGNWGGIIVLICLGLFIGGVIVVAVFGALL